MKQKTLFSIALVSVFTLSTVFFSCKKEDKVAPIVSISPNTQHIYANAGDLINFGVSISTTANLSKVIIKGQADNELPIILFPE